MNFLAGVNRVLQSTGWLRGDTDPVTSFTDLQHGSTVSNAQIAIQDELNELISDTLLPYEKTTTGSITTTASTPSSLNRSYSLPSDFIRFYGTAMLYESTSNLELFEYPGGEDKLRRDIFNYRSNIGNPYCWYFELGQTKKISFFNVPQEAKTYTFDYEASVAVVNTTDTLPFITEAEAQAFIRLASRRFQLITNGEDIGKLPSDPERMAAKATLAALIAGKNPPRGWAPRYQR